MTKSLSTELERISDGRSTTMPPPPSGITMREWFAGQALGNPELMRGIRPEDRINEARRLADEMISALANPRVKCNADAPIGSINDELERTNKQVRKASSSFVAATEHLRSTTIPSPGGYSYINDQ